MYFLSLPEVTSAALVVKGASKAGIFACEELSDVRFCTRSILSNMPIRSRFSSSAMSLLAPTSPRKSLIKAELPLIADCVTAFITCCVSMPRTIGITIACDGS